jgi:hypothetical protein
MFRHEQVCSIQLTLQMMIDIVVGLVVSLSGLAPGTQARDSELPVAEGFRLPPEVHSARAAYSPTFCIIRIF